MILYVLLWLMMLNIFISLFHLMLDSYPRVTDTDRWQDVFTVITGGMCVYFLHNYIYG